MLFNFGKYKCPHIGPGNAGMNYEIGGTIPSKIMKDNDLGVTMNASMNYEIGGTILNTTVKEKYLGVTTNANMKVSEQCRIAAFKGNQVYGMIRRK